jgi:lipopolysaccharide transport system ATP-binding protein
MDGIAISARAIGKRYRIAHASGTQGSGMLRDAIANTARAPFRLARRMLSRRAGANPVPPSYEEFWALRDVTFDVAHGERVGIIGRNGAGKSTLLKILSRVTAPTTGRAVVRGRMASLLEVGTGFHPELTGRENILLNGAILGMKRQEIVARFDEIVAFAEVDRFLDTPVKFYSSGMYVRLAFAVAAHLDPDILVIDEVLAVGDAAFQKKCLQKMNSVSRSDGRTLLFVTHNLSLLEALCERAYLLSEGRVVTSGRTADVVRAYLTSTSAAGHSARVRSDALRWVGLVNASSLQDLRPDSDISMQFEVATGERDLDGLDFDVAVHNAKDEMVVHAMSRFVAPPLSLPRRTNAVVSYTIKSPKLVPGEYYVSVYVADRQRTLLWVEGVPAFTVTAASYFGVLEVISGIKSPIVPEFEISVRVLAGVVQ